MKLLNLFISSLLLLNVQSYAQVGNKIAPKSDFSPGGNIIFFDDFSTGNIGDLPAQWKTNGSGKIVTIPQLPGRWFQMIKSGYFIPQIKEKFTDNFTIEFDFTMPKSSNTTPVSGMAFLLVSGSLNNPNEGGILPGNAGISFSPNIDKVNWANWSDVDEGHKDDGTVPFSFNPGEKYHVAFSVQNQRVRMYANDTKILDLANGLIEGYTFNIFRIQVNVEVTPMISNFRVAAFLPNQ